MTGTSLSRAFFHCTNLIEVDLSDLVTTNNVTDLSNMFYDCTSLKKVKFGNLDTSSVTTLDQTFNSCTSLEEVDISNFNTSNVTNMHYLFYQVNNISSLDLSNWDFGKIVDFRSAFYKYGGTGFINLQFGYDLGKGYLTTASANYSYYEVNFSYHTNLTHDSLISIINGLYDIATAGVQTQKLVLGSTNLAKLSSSEIAIATNKGWTVS